MAGWAEFRCSGVGAARRSRPQAQDSGGLAVLATVRRDGGPRLHPVSTLIVREPLYVFMQSMSPK